MDLDENDEDYVAYAEGNYTEEDMYCNRVENNTYLRVALDIKAKVADAGKEFTYAGYVFTILSNKLAISNNFIGMAKYYDEEILNYMYTDDEITCTLDAIIANMFE